MKNQRKALTKLAIKATVFNKLRANLFEKTEGFKPKKVDEFKAIMKGTPLYDLIDDVREAHNLLNNLKRKRKARHQVELARQKRGYKAKRKTSKAEYEILMSKGIVVK
jgi:hypothetical protein